MYALFLFEIPFSAKEGKKGLTMDEFRVAMKGTVAYHLEDSKIDAIFMKVTVFCRLLFS